MTDDHLFQAAALERAITALIAAAGSHHNEASHVARSLVESNLRGHDSHGIIAIPTYIDRIKAGHIVPGAPWTIGQESPTTTVISKTKTKKHPRSHEGHHRTYTIQSGDTLGSIAAKTGTTVARLEQLNPGIDPTALHVGQTIRVQ